MSKTKELNKRPSLSDTEIVTVFNLIYVFHMPYLDARSCLKDGVAEKLISLWIDFEKKARLAATGSSNVKKEENSDKGPVENN